MTHDDVLKWASRGALEITCVSLAFGEIETVGGTLADGEAWSMTADALCDAIASGIRYFMRTSSSAFLVTAHRQQNGKVALGTGLHENALFLLPRCPRQHSRR